MRDITYNFGGFCYIFLCGGGCDNDSGTYPSSTGSDYIQPYTLTDSDFDTYLVSPATAYDKGYKYAKALSDAALESTGEPYFGIPQCTDEGSGIFMCQQYQRAMGQDADGAPRFNTRRQVDWMYMLGFISTTEADYG